MKLFIQKYAIQIIILFFVLILILVFILFKSGSFFSNDPKDEISSLVKKVGEHMFLPEGENPTLATVSDPEALQGQEFFLNAKKGDKVLIYTNARKAILYDPVADKIVTIAPVSTDNINRPNPFLENQNATIIQDQF
jgi:hypothetical protein